MFGIGDVDAGEEEFFELGSDGAAFDGGVAVGVFVPEMAGVDVVGKAAHDGDGRDFGEDGGAGIAGAGGGIPDFGVLR